VPCKGSQENDAKEMEVKSRDCLEWKEKNYFIEGVGVEKPK
jgi:hypothetical protein